MPNILSSNHLQGKRFEKYCAALYSKSRISTETSCPRLSSTAGLFHVKRPGVPVLVALFHVKQRPMFHVERPAVRSRGCHIECGWNTEPTEEVDVRPRVEAATISPDMRTLTLLSRARCASCTVSRERRGCSVRTVRINRLRSVL